MYHHVFIKRKEVIKFGMYISSHFDQKERSYKVAVCTYHHMLNKRKEVVKLRYVYTSSRVNQKEKKL